jgi:hypothetical protein
LLTDLRMLAVLLICMQARMIVYLANHYAHVAAYAKVIYSGGFRF